MIQKSISLTNDGALAFAGVDVRALAEKYGLLTVDFYAALADRREELLLPDGVHFCNEGYQVLAKILADTLLALL